MDKATKKNKEFYDTNWARFVDQKIYGPASHWHRSLVFNILKMIIYDSGIKHILDVGCGEGTIAYNLAKAFPQAQIKGVDFSNTGIKCGKMNYKLSNLEFALDNRNISLMIKKYDLITCFEVLEHVGKWETLLGKICKSSKKYVMISFPTGRMRPFEKNVGHARNFAKGQVEEQMKKFGFVPVTLYYAGFPFYSPIYRDLCNVVNMGNDGFSLGKYSAFKKMISFIIYITFRYFSTKRHFGDEFIGLFIRDIKKRHA